MVPPVAPVLAPAAPPSATGGFAAASLAPACCSRIIALQTGVATGQSQEAGDKNGYHRRRLFEHLLLRVLTY